MIIKISPIIKRILKKPYLYYNKNYSTHPNFRDVSFRKKQGKFLEYKTRLIQNDF